jgi:hypothetical protein
MAAENPKACGLIFWFYNATNGSTYKNTKILPQA